MQQGMGGWAVRVILIPETLKQGLPSFAEGSSCFLTTPMAGPKEVVLFGYRHLTLNHPEVFRASLFLRDGEVPLPGVPRDPARFLPSPHPQAPSVCLPVFYQSGLPVRGHPVPAGQPE